MDIVHKICECHACAAIRERRYDPCDCESYETCHGKETYPVHSLYYPGQAPNQKRFITRESDSE